MNSDLIHFAIVLTVTFTILLLTIVVFIAFFYCIKYTKLAPAPEPVPYVLPQLSKKALKKLKSKKVGEVGMPSKPVYDPTRTRFVDMSILPVNTLQQIRLDRAYDSYIVELPLWVWMPTSEYLATLTDKFRETDDASSVKGQPILPCIVRSKENADQPGVHKKKVVIKSKEELKTAKRLSPKAASPKKTDSRQTYMDSIKNIIHLQRHPRGSKESAERLDKKRQIEEMTKRQQVKKKQAYELRKMSIAKSSTRVMEMLASHSLRPKRTGFFEFMTSRTQLIDDVGVYFPTPSSSTSSFRRPKRSRKTSVKIPSRYRRRRRSKIELGIRRSQEFLSSLSRSRGRKDRSSEKRKSL